MAKNNRFNLKCLFLVDHFIWKRERRKERTLTLKSNKTHVLLFTCRYFYFCVRSTTRCLHCLVFVHI